MKKKHIKVLKEISESIPQELLLNITKKEKQYSTLKQVAEHALTKPDSEVSPKEKRKLQSLLDSGYLEREVEVINTPVEQQISDYVEKEIDRAVKEGRLPKKAPQLKLNSKVNKGKQYAKRKAAQLKALFGGGVEGTESGHDSENKEESHARGNNVEVLPELGIERNQQGEEGEDRS
jgi:hypothetical protein